MLPTITAVTLCGPGHVVPCHSSHLPRVGSEPGLLQKQQHAEALGHGRVSRTRPEWLARKDAATKGEVRNIKVLGVIRGRLVVAFQGQGDLRVYLNSQQSLELEKVAGKGEFKEPYRDWIDSRPTHYECMKCHFQGELPMPKSRRCTQMVFPEPSATNASVLSLIGSDEKKMCRGELLAFGSDHQFAEYRLGVRDRNHPDNNKDYKKVAVWLDLDVDEEGNRFMPARLPAKVVVVGRTTPGHDIGDAAHRPVHEAHVEAQLSAAGQVMKVQTFQCIKGIPKPFSTGTVKHLSASQKFFSGNSALAKPPPPKLSRSASGLL